ncbi:hypothetical protein TI39_contig831g00003 [Zymoseptoria brevis]|uniref:Uncharacterized protein n=1 Tax=Zymoseptoria brevis TaxID=1047168 RepID=A0A0F4GFN5_9PEZI|nr:hypothetical protein TI39_contig831g00003 [Zymoseptoria brevis]
MEKEVNQPKIHINLNRTKAKSEDQQAQNSPLGARTTREDQQATMAQTLQQHIYLPIPSLKTVPKNPSNQERLDLIIANVEKNHKKVQSNIIAAAKAQLDRDIESARIRNQTHEDNLPDPDAMDISPTISPAKREDNLPDPDAMDISQTISPAKRSTALEAKEAKELLLASLRAPSPPPGLDPYQSTRATFPKPPPHMRPSTPPRPIRAAKQTMDAVEAYNEHAGHLTEHYAHALQRRRNQPVTNHPVAKKAEIGHTWGQAPLHPPPRPAYREEMMKATSTFHDEDTSPYNVPHYLYYQDEDDDLPMPASGTYAPDPHALCPPIAPDREDGYEDLPLLNANASIPR